LFYRKGIIQIDYVLIANLCFEVIKNTLIERKGSKTCLDKYKRLENGISVNGFCFLKKNHLIT